ncbi:hypothetical protein RF11_04291 [Thelohanellus kitauei]|uniref:Uncharacterized protein n=1 Tax=Thelohanellus kitauei TaxID=669202 RepID=A0A0C2M7D7_THEKT|nr:hypothetical protein RF11_04291 [Thelohanellus kitauei]
MCLNRTELDLPQPKPPTKPFSLQLYLVKHSLFWNPSVAGLHKDLENQKLGERFEYAPSFIEIGFGPTAKFPYKVNTDDPKIKINVCCSHGCIKLKLEWLAINQWCFLGLAMRISRDGTA